MRPARRGRSRCRARGSKARLSAANQTSGTSNRFVNGVDRCPCVDEERCRLSTVHAHNDDRLPGSEIDSNFESGLRTADQSNHSERSDQHRSHHAGSGIVPSRRISRSSAARRTAAAGARRHTTRPFAAALASLKRWASNRQSFWASRRASSRPMASCRLPTRRPTWTSRKCGALARDSSRRSRFTLIRRAGKPSWRELTVQSRRSQRRVGL